MGEQANIHTPPHRAKLQNEAEDMMDMMRGRIAKITISVNGIKIHQVHDVMHSTLHRSRRLCIQHVFLFASRNTVHALANWAHGILYYAMPAILFPFRISSMIVIV